MSSPAYEMPKHKNADPLHPPGRWLIFSFGTPHNVWPPPSYYQRFHSSTVVVINYFLVVVVSFLTPDIMVKRLCSKYYFVLNYVSRNVVKKVNVGLGQIAFLKELDKTKTFQRDSWYNSAYCCSRKCMEIDFKGSSFCRIYLFILCANLQFPLVILFC